MTKRSQQLVIPVDGLYFLLKDIRENQAEPFNFPVEWKKDFLKDFFEKLVTDGVGKWVKPNELPNAVGDTASLIVGSDGVRLAKSVDGTKSDAKVHTSSPVCESTDSGV